MENKDKGELVVLQDNEPNPTSLIQLAIKSKLPMEQLERLMAMKKAYDSDIAKKDFLAAMSLFQGQVPPLQKTKLVDFPTQGGGRKKYKYAPLGEIAETIKSSLSAAKLSYRWDIKDDNTQISCTCIISHISGHSECTTMVGAKDVSGGKNDIQSRGSTITYLQRYTLIAALGIATADEDNDGNTQAEPPQQQRAQQPQAQQPTQAQQPPAPAPANPKRVQQPPAPEDRPTLEKMDGKDMSKEWLQVVDRLLNGSTTVEVVEKYYKLTAEIKTELSNIKVTKK